MICPTCLEEVGDVTAHFCPGPPRGTVGERWDHGPPGAVNLTPFQPDQERRIREIFDELATPRLRASIELGQLEAIAEAKFRKIVREEIETWAREQLGIEEAT